MMQRGTLMRKDKQLKKFVHASCARVQQAVIDRFKDVSATPPVSASAVLRSGADITQVSATDATTSASGIPSASPSTLPHGLAGSSLSDYSMEWSRYLKFALQRSGSVPGRDKKWDMQLIWDYLQFRAQTCKPETVKQILTKLAHFGARFKFVLATSKFDGDAYVFRSVTKMKKQLAIDARDTAKQKGVVYAPVDRCTPVGSRDISMMLSAFGVTSESKFNALPRKDRHHIAASVMKHSGGMRFGGFADREYTLDSFKIDSANGTIRLVTDWARYSGRRQYSIEFPANPRFEAMWYHVYSPGGDLVDTYPAATVLHWHFRQLQRAGERRVFAPVPGDSCSRTDRQTWIREVLYDALPVSEHEARAAVVHVTPHSFRAGLAGDLYREGVSLQRIASICRWNTQRVVRLYAERPCLSMFRRSSVVRQIHRC